MKNTYKITISDSDGILFSCTHVAPRYTVYQIPQTLIEELGRRYAPCHLECACTNEGWCADRDFT